MNARLNHDGRKPTTPTGTPAAGSRSEPRKASAAVRCQGRIQGVLFSRRRRATVNALEDLSLEVHGGRIRSLAGAQRLRKDNAPALDRGPRGTGQRGSLDERRHRLLRAEERIDVPAERRRLGMMFQSYALWPNMTAFRNVAYPLTCQKLGKREIASEVGETLSS